MNFADFVEKYSVRMVATRTDSNRNMENSADMDHWLVRLTFERNSMELVFSQGRGHNGKAPELEGVLSCLASDAASMDAARSFEDWANELGFDHDSRKAEKIYNATRKQVDDLRALFGNTDGFDVLLAGLIEHGGQCTGGKYDASTDTHVSCQELTENEGEWCGYCKANP
jgi:hypothetical protein